MNTPTPRTDAAVKLTFAAGHNTVCPNFARTLERELTALTAERDQLRAENDTLRAAQKACEACDEPTAFEVRQLRDELAAARQRETVAIASWDDERNRALREGARVVEWRDRAERAEANETVALARWNGALERAMKAEADLAARQENFYDVYDELRADYDELRADVVRLTAERDQLRADCENETKWAAHYLAQSIADRARAERAEAIAAMKEGAK